MGKPQCILHEVVKFEGVAVEKFKGHMGVKHRQL